MSDESTIFNEKATRRLKSPDDVDEYIRISSPSVKLILCACVALLVGVLAWGVFGSVTTRVTTKGTVIDGKALCFLGEEDVEKLQVGNDASMGGVSLVVASVSEIPVSRRTATQIVDDEYLLNAVMEDEWAYPVVLEGDGMDALPQDVPLTSSITVERIAPISLLLRG